MQRAVPKEHARRFSPMQAQCSQPSPNLITNATNSLITSQIDQTPHPTVHNQSKRVIGPA